MPATQPPAGLVQDDAAAGAALAAEIRDYLDILGSRERIVGIIKGELQEARDAFATPRRTEIAEGGADLLVVGTDEPVYTKLLPGFAYHRELMTMAWAGIPAADVPRAATINGARALGAGKPRGRHGAFHNTHGAHAVPRCPRA